RIAKPPSPPPHHIPNSRILCAKPSNIRSHYQKLPGIERPRPKRIPNPLGQLPISQICRSRSTIEQLDPLIPLIVAGRLIHDLIDDHVRSHHETALQRLNGRTRPPLTGYILTFTPS